MPTLAEMNRHMRGTGFAHTPTYACSFLGGLFRQLGA